MTVTATTEFGATQWVDRILGNAGAHPMILLAMTAGLMATGRFFAGPLVHRLNPIGVLVVSAILSCVGLYLLSMVTGPMVYVAAAIFAIGICYFWPTMIGVTAEYVPKSGALGLSLVGGAGMLGAGIWNPIIGGWIDSGRKTAEAAGLTGDAADLAAGQATLSSLAIFPMVLIVAFGILYFFRNKIIANAAADKAEMG